MPYPSMGPKWFWSVQNVLDGYQSFWDRSNSFWTGPNDKKLVQKYNLNLKIELDTAQTNWTQPKQFVPVQNNMDDPKSFKLERPDIILMANKTTLNKTTNKKGIFQILLLFSPGLLLAGSGNRSSNCHFQTSFNQTNT